MISAVVEYYNDLSRKLDVKVYPSCFALGKPHREIDLIVKVTFPPLGNVHRIPRKLKSGDFSHPPIPNVIWYVFECKGHKATVKELEDFYNKLINCRFIRFTKKHTLKPHVVHGEVMGTKLKTIRKDVVPIFVALTYDKECYAKADTLGIQLLWLTDLLRVLRKYGKKVTLTYVNRLYEQTPLKSFRGYKTTRNALRANFIAFLYDKVLQIEKPELIRSLISKLKESSR